jgi:hypothetical protein
MWKASKEEYKNVGAQHAAPALMCIYGANCKKYGIF